MKTILLIEDDSDMRENTCSAGVATRFSTSLADAPGKGTKTLAMVTSICGSSSRGVISVAKMPINKATKASRGVICDAWKALAVRPEIPRCMTCYLPFSFMMPSASITSFSTTVSVVPRFILRMKYFS